MVEEKADMEAVVTEDEDEVDLEDKLTDCLQTSNIDQARALIEQGADFNRVIQHGFNVLDYAYDAAVASGRLDSFNLLLQTGRLYLGGPEIYNLCEYANPRGEEEAKYAQYTRERVLDLHSEVEAVPGWSDGNGRRVVLEQLFDLLVESGADVNQVQTSNPDTPVSHAEWLARLEEDHLWTVRGTVDGKGRTDGYNEAVAFFKTEMFSESLVFSLLENNRFQMLEKLLRTPGYNINQPSFHCPLYYAMSKLSYDPFKLLLQYGCQPRFWYTSGTEKKLFQAAHFADPNYLDKGWLHYLLQFRWIFPMPASAINRKIRLLVQAGFDVARTDWLFVPEVPEVSDGHMEDHVELLQLIDWLRDRASTPKPLKEMCRTVVRFIIKDNFISGMQNLPIPDVMKNYLMLKH
ncbi:uncharacterized protein LOC124289417 [Haliotis rubra]|uniref:uncharacterized protein LOC124289417 n=1 Tax=Haliotis rubra TaxID=36100 RepID=UPI001EE5B665|nr:uncharacterized protein LOC124289417 [Haliotis rubra]